METSQQLINNSQTEEQQLVNNTRWLESHGMMSKPDTHAEVLKLSLDDRRVGFDDEAELSSAAGMRWMGYVVVECEM